MGTVYLVFVEIFLAESVLKYICTLKKVENVKKYEKKWHFKKLYIKNKSSKLKAKTDTKTLIFDPKL